MNSLHLSPQDSFINSFGNKPGTVGAPRVEEGVDEDTENSDPTEPPPQPPPMSLGSSLDSVDVEGAVEKPGSDGGTIG